MIWRAKTISSAHTRSTSTQMNFSLPITLVCAAGLACASFAPSAANQSGGTPAQAVAGGSIPHTHHVVLLDGLRAKTSVGVARVLIDPASQAQVVPVAASLEVTFDHDSLFHARTLEIEPVDSAEPISWTLSGVTAANALPELSANLPARKYRFDVRPKDQKTWSQVKNENDVILTWELK